MARFGQHGPDQELAVRQRAEGIPGQTDDRRAVQHRADGGHARLHADLPEQALCAAQAVSYTHLDVYKRQALNNKKSVGPVSVDRLTLCMVFDYVILLTYFQAVLPFLLIPTFLQLCLLYTSRCV